MDQEVDAALRQANAQIQAIIDERDKLKAQVARYHQAILEITVCPYCEGIGDLCAEHTPAKPEPEAETDESGMCQVCGTDEC